jgi:hypothetical protein
MRKYNYVVGFEQRNQVVYGKNVFDERYLCKVASFTKPMTILQAIRQLKALSGETKAVYKLVKVDPKKEKFKQKTL